MQVLIQQLVRILVRARFKEIRDSHKRFAPVRE
jgi:hypothetical protein